LLVLWAVVAVSSGSSLIVRTLFGTQYLPGGPALAVLAWGGLFAATGTLVLHGLVAAGRQRLLLVTNLGAMATAVVLQLVLVPRFQLIGSAVATVVALASGQLLLAVVPASRPAVVASWRAALPVLALAAASQALVAVAGLPEVMRGFVAAGLFAGGAWASGLLHADDLSALARAVGGIVRR